MAGFQSIIRRLAAVALILLMQGPAMLVQEVAWVKMLASYTQERGLKRGVIETFDGKHPCKLCKQADEIRRQEQPREPAEKPLPAKPPRLAWADMVTGEMLGVPDISGRDIPVSVIACVARDSGKGADSPEPPPPEVGCPVVG